MDDKTVNIGKIVGFYKNDETQFNVFYYADGQHEQAKTSFEVLIYEDRNETSDKMCPWPEDYYWRKFNGVIPDDAIGTPQKNQTFIGRAPFERKGFLVGSIVAGSRNITVTHSSEVSNDTVHHLDQFVEILCSSSYPKGFAWVDTTAESLLYRTGRIEAGFEFNNDQKHEGVLDIGLIWQGVRLKIGKVVGYFKDDVMNNNLFYDQNGKEAAANPYAALTYDYSTNSNNYTKTKDYVE